MELPTSNFQLSTNRGQTILIAAIFFLAISLTVVLGVSIPLVNRIESTRAEKHSIASFYAAEGAREDVLYRFIKGMTVDTVETIYYGTSTSATAATNTVFDGKEITASGNSDGFLRRNLTHLTSGSGASFNYGIQSGEGGIILENSSSITGNVASNGSVSGSGDNLIKGDVISAGASGLIEKVHATSSAYAHTIQNSSIDKDTYYQSISGTTVLGTLHPGSSDQATSTMPISDSQIEAWKQDAAAGGTVACNGETYNISGSVTLGPKKIPCNLTINGSDQVTLTGPLWVFGDIEVANTSSMRVDTSLGGTSVAVIADKPGSETLAGKINLKNTTTFYGSGHPNSYILFISQNRSAETGGDKIAIGAQNSATGKLLVYAPHGEILLQNSVSIKEVTGWRIRLKNSAEVIYETGLANLLFSSGPSGGYVQNGWKEVE